MVPNRRPKASADAEERSNNFLVTDTLYGYQLQCPCCGFLRLDPAIIRGLRVLEEIFTLRLRHGCMCVEEAKRWYRQQNPSKQAAMYRTVPMYMGGGVVLDLPVGYDETIRKQLNAVGADCYLESDTEGDHLFLVTK